jgi:uncharacterized protein (DUF952 family)
VPDDVICHLVGRDDWAACGSVASGYRPASLDTEGFIHFSAPEQVAATANRFFAGRDDLLLVIVDPLKLTAELRWEPPAGLSSGPDPDIGSGQRADGLFPHLYGLIDPGAVVAVRAFPRHPSGRFTTVRGVWAGHGLSG